MNQKSFVECDGPIRKQQAVYYFVHHARELRLTVLEVPYENQNL